jgi:hypothetical protein
LAPGEKRLTEPVLCRYVHVFHDEKRNDFKNRDMMEHRIEMGDAYLIRRAP